MTLSLLVLFSAYSASANRILREPFSSFQVGPNPHKSPVSGDLNEDGVLDLLIPTTDEFGAHWTLSLLFGNGDGTFRRPVDLWPADPAFTVVLADLNGDTHLDLVIGEISTFTAIMVMLGNGDGTFYYQPDSSSFEVGDGPHYVAIADFNSDGRVDVVVANSSSYAPRISILLGTGHGTFGQPLICPTSLPPRFPAVADFNTDGLPDVAVLIGNSVTVFPGQGDGTLLGPATYPTTPTATGLTIADLNMDGRPDLAVSTATGRAVSLFMNDGEGAFGPRADLPMYMPCRGVISSDLDGDGKIDLVVAVPDSDRVAVLLGNGNGTFAARLDATVKGARYLHAADLNSDGWPDVVAARGPQDSTSILLNAAGFDACPNVSAEFSSDIRSGLAPLTVHFSDLSAGSLTGVEWDFENDGIFDATGSAPTHTYHTSGVYTVRLRAISDTCFASKLHLAYIEALKSYRDTLTLGNVHLTAVPDTMELSVRFTGSDSLGVVSMYFAYPTSKLAFAGVRSRIPGRVFMAGVVNSRITVQWFDRTGGSDPILPSADTLFLLRFAYTGSFLDSMSVTFDRALSALGDASGNRLADVLMQDRPPFGTVTADVGPASVSGTVAYYIGDKAVPGSIIWTVPPTNPASSSADGNYFVSNLPLGDYVLRITKNDDLGGINALDALKVVRHAVGVEPLGDVNKMTAADVDLDGRVDAFDAIKIVRAAVGVETLLSGNWKFIPDSLVLVPLDRSMAGQDFLALRMGDVNGNWRVDRGLTALGATVILLPARGGGEWAREGQAAMGMRVWLPDTSVAAGAGSIDVPMRVAQFDGVGAISLRITYPPAVLSYQGLTSGIQGAGFTGNRVGDEIRIEWYDATGGASPIAIGDSTLLTLHFAVSGAAGDSAALHFTAQSSVGTDIGDPIAAVNFVDGGVRLTGVTGIGTKRTQSPELEFRPPAPNPFAGMITMRYELPDEGNVSVRVFDLAGREVRRLLDRIEDAGTHAVTFDGREQGGKRLRSGIYLVRLEVGCERRIRRIVLLP